MVPSDGVAALPAGGLENVPAHLVYAALCDASDVKTCQGDLEKLLRKEDIQPLDATRPIVFRTRQALSTAGDAASLIAALADSKNRVLRDNVPIPSVPAQLIVESAELAPAGP